MVGCWGVLELVGGDGCYLLVAGVADDEPDVVLRCECDAFGYIRRLGDVDCVIYVIAQDAGLRFWRVRVTALVGEEGCHDR